MSIYRGDFPSCDSGGGAGPSARARAYRGATWRALRPSAPDPLDVCARTPRASRIPPPPSDRPCQSSSGRGRLWDPTTTLGFGHAKRQNTPRYRVAERPSVEGEEEEKKKNECKQRGQRERERRASARDRSRGGHRHAVAVADRNDDDDAELFSFASFLSSFFLFMISE